nr:hypothetical protein Iba_chr02eCG10030 [Ipomoea batatas]
MLGLKAFVSFAPHASRSSPHPVIQTPSSPHLKPLIQTPPPKSRVSFSPTLCLSPLWCSDPLSHSGSATSPFSRDSDFDSFSGSHRRLSPTGNPRSRDMPLASSVTSHENLTGVTGNLLLLYWFAILVFLFSFFFFRQLKF